MDIQTKAVLSSALAYGITAALTPMMIRLAPRIGAVDVPQDDRRLHSRPIPRSGGIAIFAAFLLALGMIGGSGAGMIRFLLGAEIVVLLGVLDDVFRLPALLKLTVQILACALTTWRGGWQGLLSLIWLLTLVNAHNMIDGMDGLSCSIAAIEAFALSVVLMLQDQPFLSGVALILCGCALGFLPYNSHPARVFMGDAGSQLLGFVLGYVSLCIDCKGAGHLGWMIAPLIFAVPLSDLTFAVLRRLCRGQSPFAADRGHWHHRLIDRGLGQRHALFWLALFCLLLSISGVLVSRRAWYGMAVYALLWTICSVIFLEVLNGNGKEQKNTEAFLCYTENADQSKNASLKK